VLTAVERQFSTPLNDQSRARDIGLSDKEIRKFSLVKVVRAMVDPSDRNAQKAAAFEFEVSQAARAASNKDGGESNFMIPTDVLRHSVMGTYGERVISAGTNGQVGPGSTGSADIATTLMAGSFIDILRHRTTIMKLGQTMAGLVGNVDIPKQTSKTQGYWLGEDDAATEGNIDFGQIPLTPKTVAAFSDITRKLLMQSSNDVEALVRFDLAKALALAIDTAGYYGTGTNHQPQGIANYLGVNAVPFAGVYPTYPEIIELEKVIAADDADVPNMRYVGNAKFRGAMKSTLKFQAAGSATIWEQGGTMNGYGAETTNQINDGDVFFGNFSDLIIGMWGGLELTVDPYSNSNKGRIRIVVFQDVDFALRRVESFALGRKP
jgi:HK97 family phage major capsid protein